MKRKALTYSLDVGLALRIVVGLVLGEVSLDIVLGLAAGAVLGVTSGGWLSGSSSRKHSLSLPAARSAMTVRKLADCHEFASLIIDVVQNPFSWATRTSVLSAGHSSAALKDRAERLLTRSPRVARYGEARLDAAHARSGS